ncbi:rhodanese-like domain-containing protein [Bdellovibrionota bacterium FG-1]
MPNQPKIKLFRQDGCLSYFIFDPGSRELMVIDARADLMESYRTVIAEDRLKPVYFVDTRLHSHHLSGTHLLAAEFGAPIAMGAKTKSARPTRLWVDREKIRLGEYELEVIELPGISADAIGLFLNSQILFCGDAVHLGASARLDLSGTDPAAFWHTLKKGVGSLPEETLLMPAHEADGRIFSTIKMEKEKNPDWKMADLEAFLRFKAEERGRLDGAIQNRIDYNLQKMPLETQESHFGGVANHVGNGENGNRVATISVDKLAQKLKKQSSGVCYLDVREPSEYAEGHIEGTLHIPLAEVALHLEELRSLCRIYVICRSGRRSEAIAKTLDYLGFPDVVNVTGGIQAWENAGYQLKTK